MKKLGLLFLLMMLIPKAEADYSPDIKTIMKKGKIVVALADQESFPFIMKDKQGKLFGFDIDLAERVARELNVKLEFLQTAKTFDEVVEQVANKKADVAISQLSRNLRRAQSVAFTEPYCVLSLAVLVNRIKNPTITRSDIGGVLQKMNQISSTIALLNGSSYVDVAKADFPNAQIVQYSTSIEVFNAIRTGTVQFAFMDEMEAKIWLHRHPQDAINVKLVINKNRPDSISMAVSKDTPYLHDWLDLFVETVKTDGTYDRLKKYYMDNYEWLSKKSE